jgi:hypothetical protein
MKFKVTKELVREYYNNIISIDYRKAEYLLWYEIPIAYSAGDYGWSCDYYNVNGFLISTGCSPIGKNPDSEIISKYNNKATKIIFNKNLTYELKKKKVNELLKKFLKEI